MLRILIITLALGTFLSVSGPSFSATDATVVTADQLNVAGRQRMLTQRLAVRTCFAHRGSNVEENLKQVAADHQLFSKTLKDLRSANFSVKVQAELNEVQKLWNVVGKAIDHIVKSGEVSEADHKSISNQNMKLLAKSQGVVLAMLGGGSQNTEPSLKRSIDATGSLRMLSQKAAKEFCLALDDGEDRKQREIMGKTMVLFQERINKVISGSADDGFPPLTNPQTVEFMQLAKQLWRSALSEMATLYLDQATSEGVIDAMPNKSNNLIKILNAGIKEMSNDL